MWFSSRITKATDTFLKYLYFLILHDKNGYANAAVKDYVALSLLVFYKYILYDSD
jgi:hypothetical protein